MDTKIIVTYIVLYNEKIWRVNKIMVSLLFQNGDTKYHVLVSQTGRINRLDVFYQLDFIDFIW